MTVHRNKFLYNITNRRTNFQICSGTKLYVFRTRTNLKISASVGFIVKTNVTTIYVMCRNEFFKVRWLLYAPVVTICTSSYHMLQWLLYPPVVTICTSGYYRYQWLLYVPVVTICTSGYYMHHLH
jgi:hypothetical protein